MKNPTQIWIGKKYFSEIYLKNSLKINFREIIHKPRSIFTFSCYLLGLPTYSVLSNYLLEVDVMPDFYFDILL